MAHGIRIDRTSTTSADGPRACARSWRSHGLLAACLTVFGCGDAIVEGSGGGTDTEAGSSDTQAESGSGASMSNTDSSSGDGDSSTGDGDGTASGDGDGDGTTSGDGDGDGTSGDGDGTTSGDGDGDGTSGDGDGTTSGDGDGTTSGDGDGDGTSGDGDGTTSGDGDGTTSGDGDGTSSGDGDGTTGDGTTGDGTTGDGDGDGTTGDGDGTTSGDGDGTTGDGDGTTGDGTTGDGDGDGTTGDGDGTTGDGDGTTTTGDGDGTCTPTMQACATNAECCGGFCYSSSSGGPVSLPVCQDQCIDGTVFATCDENADCCGNAVCTPNGQFDVCVAVGDGDGDGDGDGTTALDCGTSQCPLQPDSVCCWDAYLAEGTPQGECVIGDPNNDGCLTDENDAGDETRIECQNSTQCALSEVCCGELYDGADGNTYRRLVCMAAGACNQGNNGGVVTCLTEGATASECPIDGFFGGPAEQTECQQSALLPTGYLVCAPPP